MFKGTITKSYVSNFSRIRKEQFQQYDIKLSEAQVYHLVLDILLLKLPQSIPSFGDGKVGSRFPGATALMKVEGQVLSFGHL